MRILLSLPPNLVDDFYELEQVGREEYFCSSDPSGIKVGSGGGTTCLLEDCWQEEDSQKEFGEWLQQEKRILLHAGGQSRRLPGYAPSGKILTPIPVFRWERGQRLAQNLLELQLPLYRKIMDKAPGRLHTLIASGDVYIRATERLQEIPDADVVCYGLWVEPQLAKNHGVFVSHRNTPHRLDFMLQKPSLEKLAELSATHLYLMDIGIWLLSDKAIQLLRKHSKDGEGHWRNYDLYADFGLALGKNPRIEDPEINELTVAILPLAGGEFYHYGTSRELISSTLAVQNLVNDQRAIMQRKVKPHPAIFVQNAVVEVKLEAVNAEVWIENSWVAERWKLRHQHIITGVPENDWSLDLPAGVCIDVVPVGEKDFIARPYGFGDAFRGKLSASDTSWMGEPFSVWLKKRGLEMADVAEHGEEMDIQSAPIFPLCHSIGELGKVIRWMMAEPQLEEGKDCWMKAERWSADRISAEADLKRLFEQRAEFRKKNWPLLARNFEKSVFYQLNLADAAREFVKYKIDLPEELSAEIPLMTRIHDCMFRARVLREGGNDDEAEEQKAFRLLGEGLIEPVQRVKVIPRMSVYRDQIVWGRSPVRIDLAGGWTDTPPYCLIAGGQVVNLAIELNGQPPIQVYVKPCQEYKITLRSIDLGATEVITSYADLLDFNRIGSPFSIPKAALALAGFVPGFCGEKYPDLLAQLKEFGCGIEVTLLAAIPAGSGLGTSSVLAATVLGALSDFCGLKWDKNEICQRTLVLEQLLTSGGGWQDQYGGVLQGIKLLQTQPGFNQSPLVKWLPDHLFTNSEYQKCHLLYYTGITRTAKNILAEIVRGMFLNETRHIRLLEEMKEHALELYDAVQQDDFSRFGNAVAKTWEQNKALDSGSNPREVEAIIQKIKDYTLGCKLPGAGGGGYLYMIAKDPDAAVQIKKILQQNPPNEKARFVEMHLSGKGLQLSRS